jgi:hypothetical protein
MHEVEASLAMKSLSHSNGKTLPESVMHVGGMFE